MHMRHCDITYDVTASLNDVTLKNKMTRFNLGDIRFCPIQHTLSMECISLDYLWKLIA